VGSEYNNRYLPLQSLHRYPSGVCKNLDLSAKPPVFQWAGVSYSARTHTIHYTQILATGSSFISELTPAKDYWTTQKRNCLPIE
jgi:hypothetical protein